MGAGGSHFHGNWKIEKFTKIVKTKRIGGLLPVICGVCSISNWQRAIERSVVNGQKLELSVESFVNRQRELRRAERNTSDRVMAFLEENA